MNGIKSLWDMWSVLWDNMKLFIDFITMPMSEAFTKAAQNIANGIWWIGSDSVIYNMIVNLIAKNSSFLNNTSLAEFILGSGIIMIVALTFIKWLIGIIT